MEQNNPLPPSYLEDGTVNPIFKSVNLFDLKDAVTLTKPDCKHDWVEDPSDNEPNYQAFMCKHCPLGQLRKKLA